MTCPADEALRDFVADRLDDGARHVVDAHVVGCPRCREQSALLAGDGWKPGEHVGRYVLLRPIGRGAAGVVYEASDPMLERRVAIKLLRSDLQQSSEGKELEARLLREAQALARLAHPNVVAVHDVGHTGRGLFIAMERIYGETLARWLRRPRSWQEVLDVYLEAGRGLAAAHASGVVHRDFKPQNVLVEESRRVCVTDFGLARVEAAPASRRLGPGEWIDVPPPSGSLTRTGTAVGTPDYMAPEQFDGLGADVRSDIFSYSVSLYAGLYGTRPFAARSFRALREAMQEGRVEPPAPDRSVPPGVRDALLRGLRASPDERPQRMEDLLAQLEGERIHEGLARAAQILREADGFFRPDEKARAMSTLAVSFLESAIAPAAPAVASIGRPDLELLPETEIRGARLVALLGGLDGYRKLASFVLAREGFPIAKDGTLAVEANAWYPLLPLVSFAHKGAASFGTGAAFDLARVWARLTLAGHPDVRGLPLAEAFSALGDRIARDYRVRDQVLEGSPLRRASVGLWTARARDDGGIEIDASDPFVCATARGFFTEVLQELAPDGCLTHRAGPCRDAGGQECGYLVMRAG